MPVKGKQLIDNTITQPKLNLSEPVLPYDAATKQYVDQNGSIEFNSISNKNMSALLTVSDGSMATNVALLDQPVAGTGVDVTVNGVAIPSGDLITDACYFSPDGVYKRAKGNERIDDNLYWSRNIAGFDLDVSDYIDYTYIISSGNDRIVILDNGDVYSYNISYDRNLFSFIGEDSESATVIIDGVAFEIGNVAGQFVFDLGNINGYEHTFTTIGEKIIVVVNSTDYDIVYDGIGSLKFTINPSIPTSNNVFEINADIAYEFSMSIIGDAGNSIIFDWGDGQSTNTIFTGSVQLITHNYTIGTYQQQWIGDYVNLKYISSNDQKISYVDIEALKKLVNLTYLELSSILLNQDCSNWSELSILTSIETFSIHNTNLYGDLSSWSALSTWTNIDKFNLRFNNFTGDLSGWSALSTWISITDFDLSSNDFSGDLASWSTLSAWTDTTRFYLEDNNFSGDLSSWSVFSNLTLMTYFSIKSNNFTGNLTGWSALSAWTNISFFYINSNSFTGDLTGWSALSAWTSITRFYIDSNNFTGDLTGWSAFSSWTSIYLFNVSDNSFTGDINTWSVFSSWTNILYFIISDNSFTSDISGWSALSTWSNITLFNISSNSLSGDLSSWSILASWASTIESFNINDNLFNGNIVSWNNFSAWTNIIYFNLGDNSFTGDISSWSAFSAWVNVLFINLDNNSFTGDLSSWSTLSACISIREFSIINFSSSITTLDFTLFNTNFNNIDLRDNSFNLTTVDGVFSHLNAQYTSNAPIINCDIKLEGGTNASPTNGMLNTDIQGIVTAFTNAGFNATITIN